MDGFDVPRWCLLLSLVVLLVLGAAWLWSSFHAFRRLRRRGVGFMTALAAAFAGNALMLVPLVEDGAAMDAHGLPGSGTPAAPGGEWMDSGCGGIGGGWGD